MKEKWIEKCKHMTPAKLKRNIILLYVLVLIVARINLIEIAITYIILAFCIVPVLKL